MSGRAPSATLPCWSTPAWTTRRGGRRSLGRRFLPALRGAETPAVPPRFATVHRRGVELLDRLTEAGDLLRAAIERADVELLTRSMARLDETERSARAFFAAAYQRVKPPG